MDECNDMLPGCAREFGMIAESLKNGVLRDKESSRQLREVHRAIIGNGKDGLNTRVDRLEQVRKWRWGLVIFFMPIVTAVTVTLLRIWLS